MSTLKARCSMMVHLLKFISEILNLQDVSAQKETANFVERMIIIVECTQQQESLRTHGTVVNCRKTYLQGLQNVKV